MRQPDSYSDEKWQVVIFMVDGKANHCGICVPARGLADLSLLGARIVDWSMGKLPKGDRLFFDIVLPEPQKALKFLERPGLLCKPIIEMEKAQKGWHLTWDAPDYVRTLRNKRSRNPDDMNCVEWVVYALELGGLMLPEDVMTPTELLEWCQLDISSYKM